MVTTHKINSPAWKKLIVTKREEKNNPVTIKNKNPVEHKLIALEKNINLKIHEIELRIKTIEQSVNLILNKLEKLELKEIT